MNHFTITRVLLLAVAATASACTMKSQEAPALTGPSEYGTSVTVTVSPDVLSQDGASQSLVTITAHDAKGQPARNISLRVATAVGASFVDFGTLSARNVVTDAGGRATLVYTAPIADSDFAVDNGTIVDIYVTPLGTDFNNSTPRLASIRLVPVGIVVPPDGLRPAFTFTPDNPNERTNVLFDASSSSAPANNPIATFAWDFGDGSTGSGRTATHSFATAGVYAVKLTIADGYGRSASTTQSITVGQGANPTANFTTSPAAPLVGQNVNFNGAGSTAATGRRIASYQWDFGDGQQATTSSATAAHAYQAAGTYTVTLVVTDDAGRSGSATLSLTVGTDAPTADFTFSPSAPTITTDVRFNSAASTATNGRTIVSYFWDFGDGSTSTASTPTKRFAAVGDYNVLLIVTDSAGKTGRVTKTVSVK